MPWSAAVSMKVCWKSFFMGDSFPEALCAVHQVSSVRTICNYLITGSGKEPVMVWSGLLKFECLTS